MDELPLDGDEEGRHRRCSRQRDQPGQRPGGGRTVGGLGELSTQLPLRCREQGLAPGHAGLGRNRHAGLPPAQRAWPLFTPVACGWRGRLAGPGSRLTAGALGLILSCLCDLGQPCLSFPSVRQDESACPGAVRRVQPGTQKKSSAFPSSSSRSHHPVPPRDRGQTCPPGRQPSKDAGKPLCRPPCSVPPPPWAGSWVGWGAVEWTAPPTLPWGKQGCLPGDLCLCREALPAPASPERGGPHRLWEDTKSPAPVRPRLFTVYKFPS